MPDPPEPTKEDFDMYDLREENKRLREVLYHAKTALEQMPIDWLPRECDVAYAKTAIAECNKILGEKK